MTHFTIDLDYADVSVTKTTTDLLIGTEMPSVEIGVPGLPGLVKVEHGDDPDVPRPSAPLVYWVGTVRPNNGNPDDLLLLKEAP